MNPIGVILRKSQLKRKGPDCVKMDQNYPEKFDMMQLEADLPTSNKKRQLAELIYEETNLAVQEGFIGEIRIHPPHECSLSVEDEDCVCKSWAGFYGRYDYAPFGSIYLDVDGSISVNVGNEFLGGNVHKLTEAGNYSLTEDDLGGPELGMETDNLTSNDNRYLLSYILAEELYWHVPDLTSDWARLEVDRVGRNSDNSSFG